MVDAVNETLAAGYSRPRSAGRRPAGEDENGQDASQDDAQEGKSGASPGSIALIGQVDTLRLDSNEPEEPDNPFAALIAHQLGLMPARPPRDR